MADIDALEITLEANAARGGRYVIRFSDGTQAELRFSRRADGAISLDSTQTPTPHRGRGVAGRLMARAATDARAQGEKLAARCSYAQAWLDQRPEWADVRAD